MFPRLLRLLHATAHHALLALVIASIIFLLESVGWLNWLDSLSLRLVSQVNGPALVAQAATGDAGDDPLVVSIPPAMYEEEFGQRSPLARDRLAVHLAAVLAQRPDVLVLDLDLSPVAGDEAAQAQLDAVLRDGVARGVRIVIATPLPVETTALYERKHAWLAGLCRDGVAFGYPWVPLSQGVVLRYVRHPGTLVDLAHRRDAQPSDPCALALAGPAQAVFLSSAFPVEQQARLHRAGTQLPLPLDALARIDAVQTDLASVLVPGTAPLAGKVVYLGGSFDAYDHFPTVLGEVSGLVLHATAHVAVDRPTSPVSHGLAFVVDLVLGVLAGFLFRRTWGGYAAAAQRLAHAPAAFWRHYVIARLWVLGNLLAFGGMLLLVFHWSGWLLTHDLWNNPGPMLLGIFIKMAIASRAPLHAGAHGGSAERAGRVDLMLFLPVVCVALYVLLFAHH